MENEVDYRPWADLIPDTLGLIFTRLPLDEVLNVVPGVCKTWAKAVRGPYCWQEIDIEDWSRYRRPESIDRMLQLLIERSRGSLRKLCVYGLSTTNSLFLIADHAKYLHNLRLPRSEISDSMVEQVAWRLSNLTSLDLSYCTKIGAPAIEAFGKNCKLLTCFQRNMHPWDVIDRTSQDDEAIAIASTMPNLKHLELAYLMITTEVVRTIMNEIHELELLDMRGCWNVKLEEEFLKGFSKLKVVGPLVVECCGGNKTTGTKNDHVETYYPGSSRFVAWGFGEMDNYDDDTDNDYGIFSDDVWDEAHEMEDLGLSYFIE